MVTRIDGVIGGSIDGFSRRFDERKNRPLVEGTKVEEVVIMLLGGKIG